jgi:hypothetical protein
VNYAKGEIRVSENRTLGLRRCNTDKIFIFRVFFFILDELQTWSESSSCSDTQMICFEGRLQVTFMVSARVKNGVPESQIFKLQKPYRVVSQMKAFDKCFPDQ